MTTARPLGIDVGGSGIKGAPVDLDKGEFAQERYKIETPDKATPEAVCDVIAQIVDRFDEVHDGSPIGVTIPGVVQHGVVKTAANIDKSWIGCEIEKLLEDRLQHDVVVVNDADAAGVGELYFGAAQGQDGLVMLDHTRHRHRHRGHVPRCAGSELGARAPRDRWGRRRAGHRELRQDRGRASATRSGPPPGCSPTTATSRT